MRAKKVILSERAVTGTDIVVAMVIFVMFIGLFSTTFIKVYKASTFATASSNAIGYISQILEQVEAIPYDGITNGTNDELAEYIKELKIPEMYKVSVDVTKYNQTAGNTSKQDIIKIVKVKIDYSLQEQNENIEIKKLKVKV